ncbi:MerR family transcriptional regulator [Spirochaeta cellobiosiphila]|uniref:MerR family transcriptional regulator n=1 Tax=Spirochaeta cellobiosiphila TaxID=504483 RepID=UPI000403EEAA|nr:MerR family transcriptional regulator [Spirochaeta cellobiosiphila]
MLISDVSEKYNISTDTLRYYERIGLIPHVNRSKSGIRDYTDENLNWVHFAISMRNAGLSIDVLTEYLSLYEQGDSTIERRKNLLLVQRNQLNDRINEMKETLGRLDKKIHNYEKVFIEKEKKLLG